eukprot:4913026-Amphidinium_carterae.1
MKTVSSRPFSASSNKHGVMQQKRLGKISGTPVLYETAHTFSGPDRFADESARTFSGPDRFEDESARTFSGPDKFVDPEWSAS